MSEQKKLEITVRSQSAPTRTTSVTIGGQQAHVAASAVTRHGQHEVPAGAITGWTCCASHHCRCSLPKVCLLSDEHCDAVRVCLYSEHDCTRLKVCTNPSCRCGRPKVVDEHHGMPI